METQVPTADLKMSSAVLSNHSLPCQINADQKIQRRSANFHPSIWDDHFLNYAYNSMEIHKEKGQIQKLMEEVKRMLLAQIRSPTVTLELIDAIQRLGVSYHFEKEIADILKQHYHSTSNTDEEKEALVGDLYSVSLSFRLLRQQGYDISCDVFNKFKLKEIGIKDSDACNVKGPLSLYEAMHLRKHGEDALEEVHASVVAYLESSVPSILSLPLKTQVSHALRQSLHKGLPRVEARFFLSIYEQDPSHSETLLTFAKLDFNHLQKVHRQELSDITRWWKDLDFKNKLPFARDRVVECFLWVLGVYFEPKYRLARRILTKVTAMTSVLDDIYDVHGTIEELQLFTEAVERWQDDAMNILPEYMQIAFEALRAIYREIEEVMDREGRSYCLQYAIEDMKIQVRAYFQEAKWFHRNYIPTVDEYMSVATVTCGYQLLVTTSLVGMGDMVTEDDFAWVFARPKIVKAACIICRVMDDIASFKFERQRGHVASIVECYTMQYGLTEEKAIDILREQVREAWKDMNEACLRLATTVPIPILRHIVNLARVMDVVYKDGDGYTHAGTVMKGCVTSLLIEPIN